MANTNSKSLFLQGLKDGLPICLGYISVSIAFGMVAISSGFTVWQAMLISLTNVTSAGQFSGINLMAAGAGYFEVGLTQLVINIRYSLMSLSLSQKVDSKFRLIDRFIISFVNTDEVFAVASSRDGELSRSYMYGLITTPYFGWALGTLLGATLSAFLPESIRLALGIAIYGMFIAIVIPPAKKQRSILAVVIIAIALSCMFRYVPYLNQLSSGFAIIVCAVAASVIGALFFPVKEAQTVEQ